MDGFNRSDAMVIDTRGLTKSYASVKVLDALSLQMPRNAIFGFLGPNGSGKSTTIKLLLGLIQPTAGAASVFGQSIQGEQRGDPQERRRKVPAADTRT